MISRGWRVSALRRLTERRVLGGGRRGHRNLWLRVWAGGQSPPAGALGRLPKKDRGSGLGTQRGETAEVEQAGPPRRPQEGV